MANDITVIWLAAALFVMAVSLFLLVRPYFPAAVTAYVSLWFMKWSHSILLRAWLITPRGFAGVLGPFF